VKIHAQLNLEKLKFSLTGYFYVSSGKRWQAISFCIDTGSPVTIISEKDRILMGIAYSELIKLPDTGGVGGRVGFYQTKEPFSFEVIGENDTYTATFNPLYFMKGRTKTARQTGKILPSILGMDFIMDCKVLTVQGRQATIET